MLRKRETYFLHRMINISYLSLLLRYNILHCHCIICGYVHRARTSGRLVGDRDRSSARRPNGLVMLSLFVETYLLVDQLLSRLNIIWGRGINIFFVDFFSETATFTNWCKHIKLICKQTKKNNLTNYSFSINLSPLLLIRQLWSAHQLVEFSIEKLNLFLSRIIHPQRQCQNLLNSNQLSPKREQLRNISS